MDTVVKYTTATNNEYFDNGEFNFTTLHLITSIKFVADLRSKLLLDKIERISIKQLKVDDSKFIYIYASHHDYTDNITTCIILECYYDNGYYSIRYVSSNALEALDLTIKQL
ncbi:hypothetical protein [Rummeliibacillus sp. POC4]|uniref:hypothetical protein n=1 Tax=Rummeliibacillus sp. POC4 TaxID=2305899 RepID=UPI000E672551|nr:hypothetical protein [Rummeliibacillus sp. POC4]RIJ63786.1 hypothetical protein D1606_13300 [Rummeliibacillus sp. POC4]